MKVETYDIIWTHCVKPATEEILGLYAESHRSEYGWYLDDSEETRIKIYEKYEEYRSLLHKNFFRGKKYDVHKIGACFARAIIEVSPIVFTPSADVPEYIALSNYWLGITASIYIVRFFLFYDYQRVNSSICEKMKQKKGRIEYPRTTPGHDLYLRGRVKVLAVNDGNNESFDFLGYADMLFWIENYNRQLLEETFNPMVIRPLKKSVN